MENPKKITTIGGQALMEGIMMVQPDRAEMARVPQRKRDKIRFIETVLSCCFMDE